MDYSGLWLSTYQYLSSDTGEKLKRSSHYVVMEQDGDTVHGTSLPKKRGSELEVAFTVREQTVLTGTWEELSSKGVRYYGAIQVLFDEDTGLLSGKWVGFNHKGNVITGPWKLERVKEKVTEEDRQKLSHAL